MKRLWIALGIVVGVLLLAAVLLPLFVNADSFRPELEQRLSAALNRKVQIGKIEASLFSGGAKADRISISDDPAFSKAPFLEASSLRIGLELAPLIFSKKIRMTGITIDDPRITLVRNAAGKWNFSTLGSAAPQKETSTQSSGPAPDISVQKFEITGGKVTLAQTGHSKEQVYDHLHLLAHNISTTSAVPFTLNLTLPGGGELQVEGSAGPLNPQDSSKTPLQATLKLENADLQTAGFLDPESALQGVLDLDGSFKSDGQHAHLEGKAKANNLKVVKGGAAVHQPVSLDYVADYALGPQSGSLNASVRTGNSTVKAGGTINAAGASTIGNLKVQGENMAVNDVEGLLPAFGVILPAGASLQGGTINLNMSAQGPLDRLVITGPVNISGTRLSGYSLSSKLGAIARFTGMQPSTDTVIQTFSSALRVAPEGIHADNIVLDVPAIGNLTGAGTVGSDSSLDFKMTLKLATGNNSLLGALTKASSQGQTSGIPFLIQGTTSKPVFMPALGNAVKSGLLQQLQGGQNQQNGDKTQGLKDALGGLFNKQKKKPPQ